MSNKHDFRYIKIFIPLFLLELFFHYIQFNNFLDDYFFRTFLFISIFSLILTILLNNLSDKLFKILGFIITFIFCAYSFAELIFKNLMGDFYSFNTVSDGATRIAQYALIFISNAKYKYYLCFVPLIVFILLNKIDLSLQLNINKYNVIILFISLMMLVNTFTYNNMLLLNNYKNYDNKTLLINKIGIVHFLFRDLASFVYTNEDLIIEDIIEEPILENNNNRIIDDSNWNNIISNEENDNLKMIDKYLINKSITDKNDKTGIYENYNFIYLMVEAFDYFTIDETLTPTLYKMYKQGNTFYNHYSPLYSCATGESEFVSYTSLFPYLNMCTPNYCHNNSYPEALPNLFKNKGYETIALHNWRDEFYERKILLPNVGFDKYIDIDDIWKDKSIVHHNGWQSDKMLIEQAIKEIENIEGNFFIDIITSVMHFPYDQSSYWGDYYLNEIKKVHGDYPIDYQRYLSKCMNFDDGLKTLLDYLDESGLADNTIICIYADHRPYWLDYNKIIDYTSNLNDRSDEYGIYKSPFIIYSANQKGEINYNYCSTLDHVPTIANLFNLDYDPRLYMGNDIYSGNQTVIFTDGNWLNNDGIYYAINDTFVSKDGKQADINHVNAINQSISNIIKISSLILNTDYFKYRNSIISPQ